MKLSTVHLEEMKYTPGKVSAIKPSVFNGILIVADEPYDEMSTAPLSRSHLNEAKRWLSDVGINIDQCAQACAINFMTRSGNKDSKSKVKTTMRYDRSNPDVRDSYAELDSLIDEIKPRVILALGTEALRALKPQCSLLKEERGAPFLYRKTVCVATFHPRDVFVQWQLRNLSIADCKKALKYAIHGWEQPIYKINFLPTFGEVMMRLGKLLKSDDLLLSVDFETTSDMFITCVGIAWTNSEAMTIPFLGEKRKRYFTEAEELEIWKRLSLLLETKPLVGHNAVHFDHLVALTRYKIRANFIEDTMFSHWECYPEYQKSLAFCNSLYTDNPYWKGVLKEARSGKVHFSEEYRYCALDCIICRQCHFALQKELEECSPTSKQHYQFNIKTSRAFQYMAAHGSLFDKDKHAHRINELEREIGTLISKFSEESGKDHQPLFVDKLSAAEKRMFSIRSPLKMKRWLYDELGLPIQTKNKKNEFGEIETTETADYLSLLYLGRAHPEHPAVLTAGLIRKKLKRLSTLVSYLYDKNSYVYWGFNVVGTVTGRASGYKPLDGIGVQPQNVSREDRDLFIAPEGFWWTKADLEGADSWTVAAQLKAVGHSQMMDDLLSGLKPAQRLAISDLVGWHLMDAAPSELLKHKSVLKTPEGKIAYRVAKAVSHGSNYGMKKRTMHKNIFKQSDGDLYVEPDECEDRQKKYNEYYGTEDLHRLMRNKMINESFLDTCSGSRRVFFGRKDDSTFREMMSYAPQNHTGFVTNQTICNLFYEDYNRFNGKLFLQPINQVHDETDLLFPKGYESHAETVFKQASAHELEFWGVKFRIPFEANYGPDWKDLEFELNIN